MADRKAEIWQSLFYSAQRIDTLIMTISGAGIYVSLESMKFMNTSKIEIPFLLKAAGFGFVIAIFLNFVSQYCSYRTHFNDWIIEDINNKNTKEKEKFKAILEKSEKSAAVYSKINDILNITSAIIMFISITTLVYILSTTF